MIEEHENQETSLQDLIDLVERDDLPTNEFTIQDKDPMVILGKLNEVIAYLQTLQATINASDSKANEALQKAIQAVADATQALSVANGIDAKATQALANAIEAVSTANTALSASNTALSASNTALSTANTALSGANSAVETAENALGTAESAETKADTAITTANGAKTTAEGIDAKATTALANSQTAVSTANTAETKAQEALDQVVAGLGTIIYRGTQLLSSLDIKPIEDDIADNTTAITALQNEKVDKVTGKQLSTEDFTTAEKNKLAGLNNYDDTQIKADISSNTNEINALHDDITAVEEAVDTTLPNQIKDKMPVVIDVGGTTNPLYMNDLENGLYLIKNCGIIYFKQNLHNGVNVVGDCLLYLYNAEYGGTSKRKFFAITASTYNTDVIIQYGVADEPSNTYDIHRFNPQDFTARNIEVSTFKATSINGFNADTIVSNALNALTIQSKGNNYIKFKTGIIIQWGYLPAVTNDTITLPTPFTTTNYSVVGSTRYDADTGSRLIVCKFSHLTTTTFQITCSTQYGRDTQFRQSDAMWIAIGK